eukprot:g43268.t1
MGYDAQLMDHHFQCATAKNRNNLLRSPTQIDRTPFIVQYFPGAEKLCHVLRSFQHVIDDDEHLTRVFPLPPLLAFKQPPNFKQAIIRSKLSRLQDNINRNTTKPCHGNLCKTYQIIDMDSTITHENTTHHVHGCYSCDSAVYLIHCWQERPES